MENIAPIRIKQRTITPHKALVSPDISSRNVLTNSPWDFVELWLKRERKQKALFYWNQAREFHNASRGLPMQSSPLLHYYAFMNSVKALLSAKNINFTERHGVTAKNMRGSTSKISLSNEGIRVQQNGILPSLSSYFGETEICNTHSLQDLLFNLPFIHRTYCLSYKTQTDMFIPIKDANFVFDRTLLYVVRVFRTKSVKK